MVLVKDKKVPSSHRLLHYDELEKWRQHNPYITASYRPASNCWRTSLTSIHAFHNESVNIWSHLLASIFFLGASILIYPVVSTRYASASHEDVVVFTSFFLGALLCFVFSTLYHVFLDHSELVSERWLLMDFVGIVCLIAGSWVPGVHYGWYCRPEISRIYTSVILFLALSCTIICTSPYCRGPTWQIYNTAMFSFMAFFGFVPMSHAALTFGIAQAHRQMGWGWFILEAIFYISGLVVYATKYPEKVKPGVFNCWGASHQIFHVLVFGGAVSHLIGITNAFDYNHDPRTRMCQKLGF